MDFKQSVNLQVKTLGTLVPDPAQHRLAVHFSPYGMGMLWMGKEDREALAFQVSESSQILDYGNDEVIRDIVRYLQSSHPWFTNAAVPVTALVPGSSFSLVPESLYDSFRREKLIAPGLIPANGEGTASEKMTHVPVYAVFTLFWNWNQQFRTHFLDHTLVHEDFPWVNAMLGEGKSILAKGDRGVLLRCTDRVKLLLMRDGKPAAFNTYTAKTPEDCLYWILLLTEQAGMKPSAMALEVLCPGEDETALLSLLRDYYSVVNHADRIFAHSRNRLLRGIRIADAFQLLSLTL
ncbi:MAG TPA: DUF3822 family protein [Bacteroidales bacterium]|nr:DUF3822 family protein [Bacteroidales bacterium]HSA43481.1 DUF3822 family protein [Bacteroidales bacterium]